MGGQSDYSYYRSQGLHSEAHQWIQQQQWSSDAEHDEKLEDLVKLMCQKHHENEKMLDYCQFIKASDTRLQLRAWVVLQGPQLVVSKLGLEEVQQIIAIGQTQEDTAVLAKAAETRLNAYLKA